MSSSRGWGRLSPSRSQLLRAVIVAQAIVAGAGVTSPAAADESIFTTQTPSGTFTDGPWELGTRFQSAVAGSVTAMRYWRDANDVGSHTGRLWDATGTLLASVTFTSGSPSGWQQQMLATAVPIMANTVYVVSVNTNDVSLNANFPYAATPAGLATSVVNGDLSTVVGNNGVFGTPGAFPTQSFNNANYFRDIVFVPSPPPICILGEKYVSVNGPGGPFVRNSVTAVNPISGAANPLVASVPGANNQPDPSVNIPAAFFGGTKVFYKFVIKNCGTVALNNVRLDDCIDARSVGAVGFLVGGVGAAGEANCEQPRLIPPSRTIGSGTLAPGATLTVTSADFAQDPISTLDVCQTYGANRTNGIVRNDSQVEADAADANRTFVNFDDLNLVQCKPPSASIKLLKQISVDGGATWLDADTVATAPAVAAPHDASYRLIVTNTGGVDLNSVFINDTVLGLVNVLIPGGTLGTGQSVTITSGTSGFSALFQRNRCTSAGEFENIATVTGTPVTGGPAVTDTNPAWLVCQSPGKTVTIGPSSMEGAIKIASGDWVNGGYSMKSTVTGDLTVVAQVTVTGPCSNGGTDTVTVPLKTLTFHNPKGASDWLPTGDANSVLSWQGSVQASVCGGAGKLDASKGAVFTATVSASPPQPGSTVTFRFKYRDPAAKGKPNTNCLDTSDPNRNRADVCGASWSATKTFDP